MLSQLIKKRYQLVLMVSYTRLLLRYYLTVEASVARNYFKEAIYLCFRALKHIQHFSL